MKTSAIIISLLLSIFFSVASFAAVPVKKETRDVAFFDQIKVGNAFVVYLSQGQTQSVTVETEENYINKITTDVKNGVLHVGLKDNLERNNRDLKTLKVYITVPSIKTLDVSAASRIITQTPFRSEEDIIIQVSGASKVDEFKLSCHRLKIAASGASKLSMDLNATELDTNISGASSVSVKGKVEKLTLNGSGASKMDVRGLTYEKENINTGGAAKLRK